MHPNVKLIEQFYQSFQQLNGNGMVACYAPEIAFSDPVFPGLKGEEAKSMWLMLCERATDLSITFDQVQADDHKGSAHWEAKYTFQGRKVHNKIDASFKFKDGKIVEHFDTFGLWRWCRMALGPVGILLGWTPLLKNKIRGQCRRDLQKFMQKKGLQKA